MSVTIRPSWVGVLSDRGVAAQAHWRVTIDGDRIGAVGPDAPLGDTVIDAPGCVLIPGLINAHTHLGVSPLGRGVVEDVDYGGRPFYMVVAGVTSVAYEPAFAAELRALMAADVVGLLRSGVTTVVSQNAAEVGPLLQLLSDSGMRAYAGPILPASPVARGSIDASGRIVRAPVPPETLQQELDTAIALHDRFDQGPDGRARVIVGPASAETCPDEFLVAMARLNRQWGVPLTLHLAQSDHDVAQARAMFGVTSTGHLADLGVVGPDLLAAHGSLLTDDDVTTLRDAGATVAHCAMRKAKEAVFSPFQLYRARGLRVVLGNDSFTTDFIEEVRFAAMLGKLAIGSAARPTAAEALQAATADAADALNRPDLGRITVGAKADLALIDLTSPWVAPVLDPIVSLVYYASGADVVATWIDGQPVVQERRVRTMDEAASREAADAAAARLWRVARDRGRLA